MWDSFRSLFLPSSYFLCAFVFFFSFFIFAVMWGFLPTYNAKALLYIVTLHTIWKMNRLKVLPSQQTIEIKNDLIMLNKKYRELNHHQILHIHCWKWMYAFCSFLFHFLRFYHHKKCEPNARGIIMSFVHFSRGLR